MSLKRCISGLHAQGKLTDEQARRAHDTFDEINQRNRKTMGDAAAQSAASTEALKTLEYQQAKVRRNKLQQIDAQRRLIADTASYNGGRGEQSPAAAAIAIFDHDGKATYDNVWANKDIIVRRTNKMLARVLDTFSRDLLGRMRNPAVMGNVLRELFGEHTGDQSAAELAQAWTTAAEFLRKRFNEAGGAIAKMENWGLPQSHDGVLIREACHDAWREFIGQRLDRSKMIDNDTGEQFTDEGLERAPAGRLRHGDD